MTDKSDRDRQRVVQTGIAAAKAEEYLLALNLLTEAYSGPAVDPKAAEGLSYYGLCLALVQKKFKPAIDLCRKAIEMQFYDGAHYENLARVYIAAGMRKKAVESAEEGLKIVPEHEGLLALRKELGIRSRPAVPFLPRENPINQMLGRARASKQPAPKKDRRG